MSCSIFAQWDLIAIREQNYFESQGGINGEFTNKAISDFSALTTRSALVSAFVAGTGLYEGINYARIGAITDDSTFAIVTGDIVSDSTGLRPARNFDGAAELNIYAAPKSNVTGYPTETLTPLSQDDIVAHFDIINGIVSSCGRYDLLMVDSKNLIGAVYLQNSGRATFSQIAPDPSINLLIERRMSKQSDFFTVLDLSS